MMSTKRVYLIERPLTATEEEGFLALLKQQEVDVLLTMPYPLLEQWGAKPLKGLSPEEVKAVNLRLLTAVNELGHVPIKKNSVAGILQYRGFPTWYYHKFRLNFSLQPHLHHLEVYRMLAEIYERVTVYAHKVPDSALIQDLKGLLFITADEIQVKPSQEPKKKAPLRPQLKLMLKRFFAGAKKASNNSGKTSRHLFILNHAHLRPVLDPENLPNLYQDNVFVGYFLRKHAHHFQLVDKLILEKGGGSIAEESGIDSDYYQRNLHFNEWIEGTSLLNPFTLWSVWRYHQHLASAYLRINRDLKDPLKRLILVELRKLHWSSLYFYFIYKAYRSYFKRKRFESVTLLDEYSPNFRAIIDAAKQEGVRTHAIQHGSLAASNPGYGYTEKDERFNPWPDRTLVWGNYWKDLLQEIAAYPRERILVTGQARTDVIPKLLATPLASEGILGAETAGKFLILFATQPQPDESLRKRAALDMFTMASRMPDAWVVLRPHPRERDVHYYKTLAQEAGCTNYSIHLDDDLFVLLRLCQVLVHCYSTVGVEAVYFGMPAIILDYLNQDVLRFAAEEVALQVQDVQGLEAALAKIIQKGWSLPETKRQAYIQKYACAVDGHVSERMAQALLGSEVPSSLY